jgi:hypothetical protein
VAFTVTSARVNHYSDVVDQLLMQAIAKAHREGIRPTAPQIDRFRNDLIRLAIIQRNLDAAINLKFGPAVRRQLNESWKRSPTFTV